MCTQLKYWGAWVIGMVVTVSSVKDIVAIIATCITVSVSVLTFIRQNKIVNKQKSKKPKIKKL